MKMSHEQRAAIIERSVSAVGDIVCLPWSRTRAERVRQDGITDTLRTLSLAIVSAATAELLDLLNARDAEIERLKAAQITWLKPIRRWTNRRKGEVLGAIAAGRVSDGEAIATYKLSNSELDLWREQLGHDGGYVGRCFGRDGSDRMYR